MVLLVPKLSSFPRAAWECRQGALRRESRPVFCVYGTQRVQYCVPTQRVGTRVSWSLGTSKSPLQRERVG